MVGMLKRLTGGQFKDGALARILAREFWSRGVAPTLQEFAAAWLNAKEKHEQPNPEWAFLLDRAKGTDMTDWKRKRAEKAAQVMRILSYISCER